MSNTVKAKKEEFKLEITNDEVFLGFEIIGLIGLDVDISECTDQEFLVRILEVILKNANKAQPQIEELLKRLTGIDTSTPFGLIEAIKECKKNEEVVNFFTQLLK